MVGDASWHGRAGARETDRPRAGGSARSPGASPSWMRARIASSMTALYWSAVNLEAGIGTEHRRRRNRGRNLGKENGASCCNVGPNRDDPRRDSLLSPRGVTPRQRLGGPIELTPQGLRHTWILDGAQTSPAEWAS